MDPTEPLCSGRGAEKNAAAAEGGGKDGDSESKRQRREPGSIYINSQGYLSTLLVIGACLGPSWLSAAGNEPLTERSAYGWVLSAGVEPAVLQQGLRWSNSTGEADKIEASRRAAAVKARGVVGDPASLRTVAITVGQGKVAEFNIEGTWNHAFSLAGI